MKKLFSKESIKDYVSLCVWIVIWAVLIRFFESLILYDNSGEFGYEIYHNFIGLFTDISFFSLATVIIFPFFMLIKLLDGKAAKICVRIIFSLLIMISWALIIYFSIAKVALDKIIFVYSLHELTHTVSSSQTAAWWSYVLLFILPISYFLVSAIKVRINRFVCWTAVFIFAAGLCSSHIIYKNRSAFKTERAYYTIINKQAYLFGTLRSETQLHKYTFEDSAEKLREYFPEHNFTDPEYPFLYLEDTKDVLSPFFNLNETKPNIVFIITEGLGSEFSGKYSSRTSCTPFLDSLAMEGLNWNNCMSTSKRTAGVLPALFTALPIGKNGFLAYKKGCPNFISLLTLLHDQGYRTSFFYGGWLGFDDMNFFTEQNKIDQYFNPEKYPQEDKNTWGVLDHILFQEAVKEITFSDTIPRVDVFMTLTTHDPFEYPDAEKYRERYKKMRATTRDNNDLPDWQLQAYSSYLYYDDCLRNLINSYSHKEGFENTIFVITGDHHFNNQNEAKTVFNVPLIVWSPMLKNSHYSPAVVSHRDISPSLLAMLKTGFGITLPKEVSWLNSGLDTVSEFRSSTFSPQMDASRNYTNMIYKDFFVNNGSVYKLLYKDNSLITKKIKDSTDYIIDLYNIYRKLDLYVADSNMLIRGNKEMERLLTKKKLTAIENESQEKRFWNSNNVPMISAHDRDNTVHFDKDFGASFISMTINDNLQVINVSMDFDIYIPSSSNSENNQAAACVVCSIEHQNKELLCWENDIINGPFFPEYDTWSHFSFSRTLRKTNYNYEKGDVLKIYIYNPGHYDLFLSDLKLNAYSLNKD